MRSRHALLAILVALAGCVPVKQYKVTGGGPYDNFAYVDSLRCGLLQVGPSNVPKEFKVVDSESFAINPAGNRFGLSTRPHDYDLRRDKDPRAPYVRDRVYLVDSDGMRVDQRWNDGLWKFHFVLDGPNGRESRDYELRLGTFNYSPVINGPPN